MRQNLPLPQVALILQNHKRPSVHTFSVSKSPLQGGWRIFPCAVKTAIFLGIFVLCKSLIYLGISGLNIKTSLTLRNLGRYEYVF
jgi:hypothetical protein